MNRLSRRGLLRGVALFGATAPLTSLPGTPWCPDEPMIPWSVRPVKILLEGMYSIDAVGVADPAAETPFSDRSYFIQSWLRLEVAGNTIDERWNDFPMGLGFDLHVTGVVHAREHDHVDIVVGGPMSVRSFRIHRIG